MAVLDFAQLMPSMRASVIREITKPCEAVT